MVWDEQSLNDIGAGITTRPFYIDKRCHRIVMVDSPPRSFFQRLSSLFPSFLEDWLRFANDLNVYK